MAEKLIKGKEIKEKWDSQTVHVTYQTEDISTEERIIGAIMGVFVGDALGNNCIWNYNISDLWNDHGTWITDYVDPVENNSQCNDTTVNPHKNFGKIVQYKAQFGCKKGWGSQTGQLIQVLLEVVSKNSLDGRKAKFIEAEYHQAINDFFENELLPKAKLEDGSGEYNPGSAFSMPMGHIHPFSGRYTNSEVRKSFNTWHNDGKKDGEWWKTPTDSNTTDIAQMCIILAAAYRDPKEVFDKVHKLVNMWYSDPYTISNTIMYAMTVHSMINGVPLDLFEPYISEMMEEKLQAFAIEGGINSYDDIRSTFIYLDLIRKPQIFNLVDDRFAGIVWGPDCIITHIMPCIYYLSFKYANDFESGVLYAANGNGNNMARAALTGGLIGAMTGINGIPGRFIDGLETGKGMVPEGYASQSEYLMNLAWRVAKGTNGEIPTLETEIFGGIGCMNYTPEEIK
jgi:ADP-ribosyl-[dinitrogen reductase] hydrolase